MLQFWYRSYMQQKLQEKGVGRRTQKSNLMCIWLEIWLKCRTFVTCSLSRSTAGDQEGQELRSCGKYEGRPRGFPKVDEHLSFDLEIFECIHIGPPTALLNMGEEMTHTDRWDLLKISRCNFKVF